MFSAHAAAAAAEAAAAAAAAAGPGSPGPGLAYGRDGGAERLGRIRTDEAGAAVGHGLLRRRRLRSAFS